MDPWYFQCCSMTAWKVPRWFCDSPGIMRPWLVWWMWCWHGNVAEGLRRPEGVNISKGRVRAEGMERSHVAAENIREQQRMLGMKFYITLRQHYSPMWTGSNPFSTASHEGHIRHLEHKRWQWQSEWQRSYPQLLGSLQGQHHQDVISTFSLTWSKRKQWVSEGSWGWLMWTASASKDCG